MQWKYRNENSQGILQKCAVATHILHNKRISKTERKGGKHFFNKLTIKVYLQTAKWDKALANIYQEMKAKKPKFLRYFLNQHWAKPYSILIFFWKSPV